MVRLVLWAALLALVPVPHVLVDVGWAPVLRILAMGGLTGWIWLTEGGLVAGLIAAILCLQVVLHGGWLLWLSGALLRRVPVARRGIAAGALIALLFALAQLPIYRTPLSNHAARADFWGMFQ